MTLHEEGEVLYVSKRSLLLQTCIGAVFFGVGLFVVGIAFGQADAWFVWVWGSFWLLISGAITINAMWGLTVSQPRFARLGDDGLQLYRQHAPVVPWSQILEAKLGPKKIEDSKSRRHLFRHPLILRLRGRSGFPTSGLRGRAFPMSTLPDGTMDWMVPLDGCPCEERDLVSKIQERIQSADPTIQAATEPAFPVLGIHRLDRPHKLSSIAPVFAIFFIGFGLFSAWKGAEAYQSGVASINWPETNGMISEATLYPKKTGFNFRVRFVYNVHGHEFTGRRVAYASMSSDSEIWANRFKKNSDVNVRYNPKNPSDSVLIPGQQNSALPAIGFGLLFATVGVMLIWAYFRAVKRPETWLQQNPTEQ